MAPTIITPERASHFVYAHKPRGWTIKQGGAHQAGASGLCCWETRTISCPVVCDDYSLVVYLHEVAHARLHGKTKKPSHVMEYEAEMWAMAQLRAAGFRVSRHIRRSARDNVAGAIKKDLAAGVPIDRQIRRWATRGRKSDPTGA